MSGVVTEEYLDDMLSKHLIQGIRSKLKDKYLSEIIAAFSKEAEEELDKELNTITLESIGRFNNHYRNAQEFFITLNIKRDSK